MSLRSFVRRLGRRVKQVVRKAAPLAAVAGIGFALGPAGAGVVPRILGGLARGAKTAGGIIGGSGGLGGRAVPPDISTPPFFPAPTPRRSLGGILPTIARLQGRVTGGQPQFPVESVAAPEQVQASPVGGMPMFHQAQAFPPNRQGAAQMSLIGAVPQLGRVLPAVGRVLQRGLPAIRRQLPGIAGGAAAGMAIDALTGQPVRKRRRMNPYNPKAARRAIRRIKALRREMQKIERMLPKQRTSSRVRHVPTRFRHTTR